MAALPSQVFALKNKGVPITLNYFKTTGSRPLPAGPERGRVTSEELLLRPEHGGSPRGERAEGPMAGGHGVTWPPRGSHRQLCLC